MTRFGRIQTMIGWFKGSRHPANGSAWAFGLAVVLCGFTTYAFSQERVFKDLLDGALNSKSSPKAEFTATLTPSNAKPGDEVTFTISAKLPPDSYIYATTGDFEARTRITETSVVGLEAIDADFRPNREPETALDSVFNRELSKFHGDVSWSKKYHVSTDADLANVAVDVKLEGQYCSDGPGGTCTQIQPPAELHAALVGAHYEDQRSLRRGKFNPGELQLRLAPTKASDGNRVKLLLTMVLRKGWHTFSTTFKGDGGTPTIIELESVYGLKSIGEGFEPDRPPEIKIITEVKEQLRQEIYHERVTWSQEFEVLPGFRPFEYGVEGSITFQTCESSCLAPRTESFTLGVTNKDIQPATNVPFLDEAAIEPVKVGNQPQDQGLIVFLLTAVLAGAVALLTPCVFPMVPITVSFFLKQSEVKGGRPIVLAFVFSAAIVASFIVIGVGIAAVFGATKANELANNWILNLFLAAIFFAFALNMLGLFEIQVPSWLLSLTSSGEQTGGYVGVVFMALTFVLTSFSCTFAFVGSLLVTAAKGQYYWPVLGMLAFGATFAAPFFVLALMPGFLRSLPKSGGWLNSVKVVMGFIEAGVAIKYISIVDQQWNSVPWLFDFTNVMTLWAVLSACTGLYLLGQFRLSHDAPVQGLSPVRVMLAMGFLVLGGLFIVGLTHPDRDAWLVDQLVAFAPAQLDNEEFILDLDDGIEDATRKNVPLFIDFTGVFCTNCRLMEKRMAKPHNHRRLERCVLVQLYTDKVPKIADEDEARRILDKNVTLQKGWFGDVTLPSYAVVTPDGKTILSSFHGLESRTGDFAKFLDKGWDKWQAMQGRKVVEADREPMH